ncbi:MAG: glutathione S-transferase family protein [Legionella sp.]
MIKLPQYPSARSLPNPSPFCMKLENYLRMAKIPFTAVTVIDPRKSPKGKLPVITDDGKPIADSDFIIKYLQQKYGDPLDSHLTESQKAHALVLRRMLEEHLYWILVYSRWLDERYWPISQKTFFGHLNSLVYYVLPKIIRKKIKRDLYQQGIGRHDADEMYQLGLDDLRALSQLLEATPFCLGNAPSSIDACVYAFLANIVYPPIPSPMQEYVRSQPHLVNYCERMKQRFYSE